MEAAIRGPFLALAFVVLTVAAGFQLHGEVTFGKILN